MKGSLWSKLKWAISVYKELKRASSPYSRLGGKLLLSSLTATAITVPLIALDFILPPNFFLKGLSMKVNEVSNFTYLIIIIVAVAGLLLIAHDIRMARRSARKIARVLIKGMPGLSYDFPNKILSKAEEQFAREPITLGLDDPNKNNIEEHIVRFNAERCVDLFKRFVLHHDCQEIYIGGLSRIPFLIAYGTFLKNISARIIYFDKFHRTAKWVKLNAEDEYITLSSSELITLPNDNGDIGIALAFSTEITPEHLPTPLEKYTTILKPNTRSDRNLVKNQDNLNRISFELQQVIDKLNNPKIERVHLFLSVQSSLAIEIGRQYQEGTHKNWVIHNYDAQESQYTWAIELYKDGIRKYETC